MPGFDDISFAHPWWLLLLLLIPILGIFQWWRKQKTEATFTLPSLDALSEVRSIRSSLVPYIPILRAIAFSAFVLAMARPQQTLKEEQVNAEGIDIMMIMDLSSSMLAQDFTPDRLSVSKEVAKQFVDKREYDRIGLVVFAGESFTQCPLTTDHRVVKDFLDNLQCGLLEDGTAIGMGLASAVNRLKESASESKVVILLTDGVNNAGYIKPMTAAEIAEEYDVKVYSIGVGSMGQARSPVRRRSDGQYIFGLARVEIDEDLLTEISDMTGGKYYRATTAESLEAIYAQIDMLEKTEIEVNTFKRYSEEYRRFMIWGFGFLLLEIILRLTILRTLP